MTLNNFIRNLNLKTFFNILEGSLKSNYIVVVWINKFLLLTVVSLTHFLTAIAYSATEIHSLHFTRILIDDFGEAKIKEDWFFEYGTKAYILRLYVEMDDV